MTEGSPLPLVKINCSQLICMASSGSFWIPGFFHSVHNDEEATTPSRIYNVLPVSPGWDPRVSLSQILPFCLTCHVEKEPKKDGAIWYVLVEWLRFCKQLDLSNHVGHQHGCLWPLGNSHIIQAGHCLLMFCWKPLEICPP